tara:strand:- start:77 stop:1069 length:993 start_codon:yes stop_codon:yes gene_type:complete
MIVAIDYISFQVDWLLLYSLKSDRLKRHERILFMMERIKKIEKRALLIFACLSFYYPALTMACPSGFLSQEASYDQAFYNDDRWGKSDFVRIAETLEAIYEPIVWQETGFDLVIYKSWASETVNAFAKQDGDKINISLHGAVLRHPWVTLDAFTLLVCHEIGHILGGQPMLAGTSWAASEGQSDYFATNKCLKRLWAIDGSMSSWEIPPDLDFYVDSCRDRYNSSDDRKVCVRSLMAGASIASLYWDVANQNEPFPEVPLKDPTIVKYTQLMHPSSQCRLDTYKAGAWCRKDFNDPFSNYDSKMGACLRDNGDLLGARPQCWYRARIPKS